jgi:hypothetical protein
MGLDQPVNPGSSLSPRKSWAILSLQASLQFGYSRIPQSADGLRTTELADGLRTAASAFQKTDKIAVWLGRNGGRAIKPLGLPSLGSLVTLIWKTLF